MNFYLLDKIDGVEAGFVATVIATQGHTYAKAGARALFRSSDPIPVVGNLGSLCADQELVAQGEAACREGVMRHVRIDASDPEDADLGYGTQCGGAMDILVEPLTAQRRTVYRELAEKLRNRRTIYLRHDRKTGASTLHDSAPEAGGGAIVQCVAPPRVLTVFGATPLAQRLIEVLSGAPFDVHVVDWRTAYLDAVTGLHPTRLRVAGEGAIGFEADGIVVIVSHSYRRDKAALKEAVTRGCAYVGMLSSSTRRDEMYAELEKEGLPPELLEKVSCPIGIDIGGRTDPEIAVSIAAEVMRLEGP
jgi:xanthine dehydrogenase accessory factor